MPKYSVYSLTDTHTVINHPSVGQKVISDEGCGGGQIVISYIGEIANHQQTANGYTVISKGRSRAGSVNLEVAQNSEADMYNRRLIDYIESAPASEFALTTITMTDTASGITYSCTGVTPQKRPDRQYAQNGGMLNYVFLCASIIES